MYLGEPNTKNRKLILGGIAAALSLLFLISFGRQLWTTLGAFFHPFTITPEQFHETQIIGFNLLVFIGVSLLWVILISWQAILPVRNLQGIYRTAFRFMLYILRLHGRAVFVRDGIVLETKEDTREGPGVVVVDFNSALVLEERIPPPGFGRDLEDLAHSVMVILGLADRPESPRVRGPGIVFTRKRERIRGAVDLRKQFRLQRTVTGYTHDGIEVNSNVWAMFTIGHDPDIVQVTYEGDQRPENLRVVRFEPIPEGNVRVGGLSDELDLLDQQEIHHYLHFAERTGRLTPYTPLEEVNALPGFNRERVFAAVFSEARGENDKVLSWTELPTRMASSLFREIIAETNFNDLFKAGDPGPFPLPRYRNQLRQAMRNNGLLSYRFVTTRTGDWLKAKKVYKQSELAATAVRALVNPKLLRDRGIKVIASGFGDILPVDEAIYRHRLESWRAPWQTDTEIAEAKYEYEVLRIQSRARAKAQQDLMASLNSIFQRADITQEVMAVRILETLDHVAADPKTRQLIPPQTADLIKHAHEWMTTPLSPQSSRGGASPFNAQPSAGGAPPPGLGSGGPGGASPPQGGGS